MFLKAYRRLLLRIYINRAERLPRNPVRKQWLITPFNGVRLDWVRSLCFAGQECFLGSLLPAFVVVVPSGSGDCSSYSISPCQPYTSTQDGQKRQDNQYLAGRLLE